MALNYTGSYTGRTNLGSFSVIINGKNQASGIKTMETPCLNCIKAINGNTATIAYDRYEQLAPDSETGEVYNGDCDLDVILRFRLTTSGVAKYLNLSLKSISVADVNDFVNYLQGALANYDVTLDISKFYITNATFNFS